MELESVEPAHRTFSLDGTSPHRPVLPLALDVAGGNRHGVDDGYTCTLARCLKGLFFQLWRKILAEFFALLNNTSLRIQKISIIFAAIMGMGIC